MGHGEVISNFEWRILASPSLGHYAALSFVVIGKGMGHRAITS
jgi:hypothetical protein